jgi:hypothetical protein
MGKCTQKLFEADSEAKNGLKWQIAHNVTKAKSIYSISLDTKAMF